ncbi:MAG TPA: DUF2795 domain-containing protein [Streptosporangiaceae bacterium]|jgi:hypothetical protein
MSDATMNSGGTTHGPQRDDVLKREVASEIRANRATSTQEWREPEPPGDDQPEATPILAGRPWAAAGSGPDPDGVQLRSDLAVHLNRAIFPADRSTLLQALGAHYAPQHLLDVVATLPSGRVWHRITEVLEDLGVPVESR